MTFSADACEWLVRSIGSSIRHFDAVQMKGSTSSAVYRIQCADGSDPRRFALRVINNREWLEEEPDLVEHEAAALAEARRAGLRAPHIVAYSSKDVGFGSPVVLMSCLEGTVELRPADFKDWIERLAGELALIHQHAAPGFGWSYASWVDRATLAPPQWTAIPHVWERAIELWLHTEPDFHPVFIHRDYHPTNVLWHERALSGVVDWISACRGPAGIDVAHCRINLVKMFGLAAADQFLQAYSEVAEGFAYNPYWDVDDVLDTCIPRAEFYPPWRDFGLGVIPSETLHQRVDAYLESVMERC